MFRADIAENISWLSEFMEIVAEQRKDLLRIRITPCLGLKNQNRI
jgi:hypothetical protein